MNQKIFNYLKNYTQEVFPMDRLLVSSYISLQQIEIKKNKEILKLLINKQDKKEYQSLNEFIDLISKVDRNFDYEDLLELFEFVISPSDRIVNGAIYTPKDIREYITNQCFSDYKKDISCAKIADISCGCGGFLIDATNILKQQTSKTYKEIFANNIFGIDIQKYSIDRAKILLSLLAINNGEDEKIFEFNLFDTDSLEFDWRQENKVINKNDGFDIILGNPPYVCSRNMDTKTKSLMPKWKTCVTGHPDLYIPFFEMGYGNLNQDGVLGYITVNSFIKSMNGRALRSFFKKEKVDLSIIDFGDEQIFRSRKTYTCICFISKIRSDSIKYKSLKRTNLIANLQYEKHLYSEIEHENGWYVKNRNIVEKIENTGIPFGEIHTTRSGIATLKNSVYIFKPIKETSKYYFLNQDIMIEKNICKDVVNSNLLVKNNQIGDFIEKIIFPYGYDLNNQTYVITEDEIQKKYPCAYNYLLKNKAVLATRDKGKGKDYEYWYAFGRNQSLEQTKYKLLFPQLAKKNFQSYISNDNNLYFYNGMAVLSNNLEELQILQKIFLTDIFWDYVTNVSKPYAAEYFSLGRNYIKKFGMCKLTATEIEYLKNEENIDRLNHIFHEKYV